MRRKSETGKEMALKFFPGRGLLTLIEMDTKIIKELLDERRIGMPENTDKNKIEAAKWMVKGMLAESPETEARVKSGVSELQKAINGMPTEIQAIVAFLIFAEYAKDWDL